MEPVTLSVIAAALVAKALDRAEDGAVDEAGSALGRLVRTVRERLSGGSKEDRAAFSGVEAAPDSARQVERLAQTLERHAADEGFREELHQLVQEAQAAAKGASVDVETIAQQARGTGIAQIGGVSASSISVKIGPQAPGGAS